MPCTRTPSARQIAQRRRRIRERDSQVRFFASLIRNEKSSSFLTKQLIIPHRMRHILLLQLRNSLFIMLFPRQRIEHFTAFRPSAFCFFRINSAPSITNVCSVTHCTGSVSVRADKYGECCLHGRVSLPFLPFASTTQNVTTTSRSRFLHAAR